MIENTEIDLNNDVNEASINNVNKIYKLIYHSAWIKNLPCLVRSQMSKCDHSILIFTVRQISFETDRRKHH